MAPGMQGSFDANQFEPRQGFDVHPAGIFDASIAATIIEANKENTGGFLKITFGTPAGRIDKRYNLWNQEPKAVEIAHHELSALCRVTGIYKIDYTNDGAALINSRLNIYVCPQIDKQTKQPTQYMEVKRVLDVNGNEPGKAPAQPQTQPLQQQPEGTWGTKQPANPPGWGGNPPAIPSTQKPPWG